MQRGGRPQKDRGRVERIKLKKPILFNSKEITEAVIEIDHINYGLNRNTQSLNKRKRTNFSVHDVEKFLMLLDGESVYARNYRGRISRFEIRIDCPVRGRFFGKEFIMIFDTDYDKPEEIYTITLYPGW